jgi:predicted deacylase
LPEQIKVGNVIANRGELKKGYIKGVYLNNSVRLDIPVLVANGVKEGKTLLVTSTEHGTEIQGIEVILQLMNNYIDPQKLNGAVIGIPVMNMTGFMANRYRSWVDHVDLSRVRADGTDQSFTGTLAHNFWTEAINKADIWLNAHCNTRPDSLHYTSINISDPRTKETNKKLAEAFPYTKMFSDRTLPENALPTYRNLAAIKGIPYLLLEYADGRWISEPATSTGIRGHLNVMKIFGMIDGKVEPHPEKFPKIEGWNKGIGLLRPKKGGLVRMLKKPGEPIKKGETVVEVYNLFGDVIEEVKMPENGYVWSYPCGDFCDTSGELQTVNTGCGMAFAFIHIGENLP